MRHRTLCCAGETEKYRNVDRNVDVTTEVHKAMHYMQLLKLSKAWAPCPVCAGRSNLPAVFRFVMRRVRLLEGEHQPQKCHK